MNVCGKRRILSPEAVATNSPAKSTTMVFV
jgi:hypothetical protein